MNAHLRGIVEMNTFWFVNSLDGVSEDQAWRRVADGANSLGFVAMHATEARYYFARLCGLDLPSPLLPFTKGVRTIDQMREHPSVAEIRGAWVALAHELHDYVAMVDIEREVEHTFPSGDKTVGGLLLFGVHHDAYHIGQMSMLRKTLGLPATKLMP